MSFEQRDMSGALFRNKKKQKGDNKPDYTGNAMVNGQTVEIAAWIKPMKKTPGQNYMSLSFKPPQQNQGGGDSMGEYQGEPAAAPYPRNPSYVQPQPIRPQRQAPPPDPDADLPF